MLAAAQPRPEADAAEPGIGLLQGSGKPFSPNPREANDFDHLQTRDFDSTQSTLRAKDRERDIIACYLCRIGLRRDLC